MGEDMKEVKNCDYDIAYRHNFSKQHIKSMDNSDVSNNSNTQIPISWAETKGISALKR